MKRILAVFGYFIMSVVLFLGGVTLNAAPSGNGTADVREPVDDTDNTDTPDDSSDADNGDTPAPGESDTGEPDSDDNAENPDISLYYYSLLDDTKKEYYDQISDAAGTEAESVTLEGITHEEAEPILISVMNDHPEYFWLENSYTYQSGDNYVKLIFNYNCTGGEKDNRQRVIEQQASQIVNGIPAESSDYDKVKYVFETLVDQTRYDKAAPDNQNIYSVFGNWTTVCAGYARATKYLLDQMGVECIYVTGNAGEPHAWNIVNCDGAYYCVDTTWGDPTYQEGIGVDVDTTSYEYLCCTTQMLSRTHTPDAMFPVPECTDTSLEYYRMEGRYLTSADQEHILNIMKADVDEGAGRTDIQFSDPDVFGQVMAQIDSLLDQAMNYEMEVKGPDSGGVSYQYNDNTCLLTVLWNN